jgi:biotin carboxyl carrier protein
VSSADGAIESVNVSEGETIEVGSVMIVIRW